MEKLKLPENFLPAAPCRECISNPERMRSNGKVCVVYCEHYQSGAILPLHNGKAAWSWTIFSPISIQAWTRILQDFNKSLATLIEDDRKQTDELAAMPDQFFFQV